MFWRGVLGYLPVNLVQAASGFGAIFLFTRLLSPADYGSYALAYATTTLINTCQYTWIEAAMARFYVAESEAGEAAVSDLLSTIYITFCVMVAAAPIIGGMALLVLPLSLSLKFAIGIGLGAGALRSLLKLMQERRRATGEVKSYAIFDMSQTGGGFVLGAAFAAVGVGGASPLLGAGIASLACLLVALPSEARRARIGRFDAERLKSYLLFGMPISLSLLMSLALATTDRIVLAAYMNDAAVGAYHAGYSLSNRTLDVIFIWLGMAGGPACILAFEKGGEPALKITAREQASFMLLITLPASAGLALISKPLADVMIGPTLRASAASVTPWIALSALFSGLTIYYLNTAFVIARKTRILLVALGVPACANIILTLALIPRFGLRGAVWATAASYALGLVASYLLSRRTLALPVPWESLFKSGLAVAVMSAVIVWVPSWGGWPELITKGFLGAAIYSAAALIVNAGDTRRYATRCWRIFKVWVAA